MLPKRIWYQDVIDASRMSAAYYLKQNFHCPVDTPFYDSKVNLTDHLRALEIGAFVSFSLLTIVALKTRRLGTFLGIIAMAGILEYAAVKSQALAHSNYKVMLTCFLPLKDVLWHANNVFASVILAQCANVGSRLHTALLVGMLSTLQHLPFEMIRTQARVEDIFVNIADFRFANLKENLNGATLFFLLVVFCAATGAGYVSYRKMDIPTPITTEVFNLFLIPILGTLAAIGTSIPYYLVKSVGCGHFLSSETNFWRFQLRCGRFSLVDDLSAFTLFAVISGIIVLSGFLKRRLPRGTGRVSGSAKLLTLIVGWISDGLVLYCLIQGSDIQTVFLYSHVVIYVSVIILKTSLAYYCLVHVPELDAVSLVRKDKAE